MGARPVVGRGQWLREQRQERGWNVPQMAHKLREAATLTGDTLPARKCVIVMIHRWENDRSGISERYRLHYCKAFQIPAGKFGGTDGSNALGIRCDAVNPDEAEAAGMPVAPAPCAASVANLKPHADNPGGSSLVLGYEQSISSQMLAAARESGKHARHAERRGLGPATLERFQGIAIRLARESRTGEPLPLFIQMRSTRDELHAAARRQCWPADQQQVYLGLGCLNSLMAAAAQQAGSSAAAGELAIAGLAYATVIGHKLLTARLRLDLATTAYWSGSFRDCQDQADAGLAHLNCGPAAAQLHLIRARAAASLGDVGTARQAIAAADQARDHPPAHVAGSDLAETVSLVGCSPAAHHYHIGSALIDIPDADKEAAVELARAIELYAAASEPGGHEHDEMTARVILAAAQLRDGDLEAAQVAVGPVLALPCSRRVASIVHSFTKVRAELAGSRYHRSPEARDFTARIERFCAHTIATHL